jgi:hypothetical protein
MLAVAITLQAVLLLYHQVTTLFDFFPFNGVRGNSLRERRLEAGVNLVFMGFPLVAFLVHRQSLMQGGVYSDFCIFAGECATWWIPYFFGPSPKWLEIYSRVQGTTIMVIPRRGTNPTPNLEHLILMVLTVSAAMAGLVAYRSLFGSLTNLGWAWLIGSLVFGAGVYQTTLMGRAKAKAPSA